MKQLPERKRGRPPLLGEKFDNFLQELITALRSNGVVISIGRGIMLKNRRLICQILAVPLFFIVTVRTYMEKLSLKEPSSHQWLDSFIQNILNNY